jgi:hypothetical protein
MMIYHEMRTNIRDMKNFCTLPFPHKRRGESTVNLSTDNKKESVVDDRERKRFTNNITSAFKLLEIVKEGERCLHRGKFRRSGKRGFRVFLL